MLQSKSPLTFKGRQSGFTVIELLVTIVIASILLAVAIPSFQSIILNNRLTTQSGDFMSALYLTRSEAIKRGTRVTLCKSADGKSCSKNGDWDQGWIVFVDSANENQYPIRDDGETILRIHHALEGGNKMVGENNVTDYISYVANGFSRTVSIPNTVQTGTLTLCDSRNDNDKARAIIINATGHPQLTSVKKAGNGLTC